MKTTVSYLYGLLLLLSASCSSPEEKNSSKESDTQAKVLKAEPEATRDNYDISKPTQKWTLPDELKEISGNSWIDNNHLLAIEDLHSILYLIRFDKNAAIEKKVPFMEQEKRKFDIEDIAVAGNTVYVLWSHGTIFKITDWKSNPTVKEIPTILNKDNNTEGMCVDPVSGNLLIACKNHADASDEEKKSTRAIYEFDIKTDQLKPDPFFLILKKEFKKVTGNSIEFYPSGIAVHPVTHDIYILSTKGTKCVARFAHTGELKSVQFINEELLPQPEGICFSPESVMYISSEGKKGSSAVICQFDPAK